MKRLFTELKRRNVYRGAVLPFENLSRDPDISRSQEPKPEKSAVTRFARSLNKKLAAPKQEK
jgi:hypothetical protein